MPSPLTAAASTLTTMAFEPLLLNDGNKIPTIGFGTGSKWKWRDVTRYVEQAIEVGFWHIDTADFYETETYVGKAIKESGLARDEVFVTTKFLYIHKNAGVQESIRQSLSDLNMKYVDLYLIHNPKYVPNEDIETTWREFEKVKQDGLAKSIGISNSNVEDLQKLLKTAKILPALNQIELHPYNYHEQKPIIEFCASRNIAIEAYSTLTCTISRYAICSSAQAHTLLTGPLHNILVDLSTNRWQKQPKD
ncbi:hypothetical protein E1B28_012171 [Marasmius oreades]|uniref:NADP-dependent oxidoreductase domain-containing protein n=1 Tax=Marasmius oreades TaxID=181124 RepID=A0A9P7RRS0_9AGAR|nr:uncharacterized protein E1B28_012171 [Marasmius oreades]KAG7088150.1 hypothetical protein E1B28_012171 [Marasmius oreades]